MYKKSAVIICFLFLILSGALFVYVLTTGVQKPSYDGFGCGMEHKGDYYYVDGGNDGMRFFVLDKFGNVLSIYTAADIKTVDLCDDGERIFVLQEDEMRVDETGRYRSYRLREFTEGLLPVGTTAAFELHAGEQAVDVNIENGLINISAISSDGKTAEVYSLELEELMELGDAEREARNAALEAGDPEPQTEAVGADSILLVNSDKGRIFVDAAYREGILYKRCDQDEPRGIFLMNEDMKKAVENVQLSFGQSITLSGSLTIYWVAGTALILVFFILSFLAFANRRRLVYTGLLVEVIFVAMLLVFFVGYSRQSSEVRKQSRREYADNALSWLSSQMGTIDSWAKGSTGKGWFDSIAYRGAQGTMHDFVLQDGNRSIFYNAFVLRISDGIIICSADGRAREKASDLYGDNELWSSLKTSSSSISTAELGITGRGFAAKALKQGGSRSDYALVGIINDSTSGAPIYEQAGLLRNLLLIFVVGSAVLFLILWLQAADMRHFEKALAAVATRGGENSKKRGKVTGHDLDHMWNSLGEINKKIEKIDYARFQIYEAYYRFAPRNIEKILQKNSIFEVQSGDTAVVNGTLAYVGSNRSVQADQRIAQLNRLLDFVTMDREREAIVVGENDGLAVTELLFLEDANYTQDFAVSLIRSEQEKNRQKTDMSVLLYYGSYTYGIAGTDSQSMPFLIAAESRELSRLAEWFYTLNVYAVVTAEVKDREPAAYDTRYIGFVRLSGSGRELKLFEVLDACPKRERQAKLDDRDRFSEALALFYQKDYYIARNAFSDILKRNPTDEMARWYLFESERLLDKGAAAGEHAGALYADN